MTASLAPRKVPAADGEHGTGHHRDGRDPGIDRDRRDDNKPGQPVILHEDLRYAGSDSIQPSIAGIDLRAARSVQERHQRMNCIRHVDAAELMQSAQQQYGCDAEREVQSRHAVVTDHEGKGTRENGRECRRQRDVED